MTAYDGCERVNSDEGAPVMAPSTATPVLFPVVPFLPVTAPALGVSLLAAVLSRQGIPSRIQYFSHDYCLSVPSELQSLVCELAPLGDMVFAGALWGTSAPSWNEFAVRMARQIRTLRHVVGTMGRDEPFHDWADRVWRASESHLRQMYVDAPHVVARWADHILDQSPRVVGFTSTFQQHVAALALAKELRRRAGDDLTILFGGANCDGDAGAALAREFPFIDHVVSGDGEGVITGLAEQALGRSTHRYPRHIVSTPVQDLDELPQPDFSDYFGAIRGTAVEEEAVLAVESSRGCWWGAKSQCKFCGLNGASLGYRSKAPGRFVDELLEQSARYGLTRYRVTDCVLDPRYIETVFPELVARADGIALFYETRSTLRKDELLLLRAGGVGWIQPGIEHLSTSVLRLMAKGTTALQGIQLLKWCEELGIGTTWNLLVGFPGEPPEEYAAIADLVPALTHLEPPTLTPLRLARFSPYWRDPAKYGLSGVRPSWGYDTLYAPLPDASREALAHFFEFDYADERDVAQYVAPAQAAVARWHDRRACQATLEFRTTPGGFAVADSRDGDPERLHQIAPSERRLLLLLDGIRSEVGLVAAYNDGIAPEERLGEEELQRMLQRFRDRRWVVGEGRRLLSVVLDRGERRRVEDLREAILLAHVGLRAKDATLLRPPDHRLMVDGGLS